MKDENGKFKKGNPGFWLGKKRPELKEGNASKTMFKKGLIPWNKGKAGAYKLDVDRKGRRFNTGKTHFKKGETPPPHRVRRGEDHPMFGKPKLAFRGENNPMWNGGTTLLRDQIRKTIEYKRWRLEVFKRDNFTCQLCLKEKEVRAILEADHIVPFAALLKIHEISSVEDATGCTELWNINNGRTLCKPCHKTTKTYLNREEVRRFYVVH